MFRLPNPWADKETAADHQTEAGQLVFNRRGHTEHVHGSICCNMWGWCSAGTGLQMLGCRTVSLKAGILWALAASVRWACLATGCLSLPE